MLWVRVHTDAGVIGLGETFYGAGAVEAHIHDTLAAGCSAAIRCTSRRIHRDMLNLPMAQSSTGAEYRAASAIDIALWDMFGKVCGQPVHQMLGGLCRDKLRIYNTCAGYGYVRSTNIKPVSNWNLGEAQGPYEDLARVHEPRRRRGREPARERHHGDEDLAVRSGCDREPTVCSSRAEQMKKAIEPFEKIRKAVGDQMEIMVEFHSLWNLPDGEADRPRARAVHADVVRGSDPDELAAGAGRVRALDRRLGLRERDARLALPVQGHARARRHRTSSWSICAGPAD